MQQQKKEYKWERMYLSVDKISTHLGKRPDGQ